MENDSASRGHRARLARAVGTFNVVMFVTNALDGELNVRPMTIVSRSDEIEELLFVTHKDGLPAREIAKDKRVSLLMQSELAYVHLCGAAELFTDDALAKAHWKPGWLEWFAEGPRSPSLLFIRVRPTVGAVWDSGLSGSLRYLFDKTG